MDENEQELSQDDFVTVMTFTYSVELAVLKGRLEAEGIEYRVLNELTTEIYPFLSNAVGGVKLQVRKSDVENTIGILKEGGYLNEELSQPPYFITKIKSIISRLPLINKLEPRLQLVIIFGLLIFLIASIVLFASLPSTAERLTNQSWCLDKVTYLEKDYPVKTTGLRFIIVGGCEESIDIRGDGRISLPGFNSREAKGKWMLIDNSLQIMFTDTFGFVYNGVYEIDFTIEGLILKSEQTTLQCYSQVGLIGF